MKKPHTISAYECVYEGEDLVEERLRAVTKYDEEGQVVHRESFDTEGTLVKREVYDFDNGVSVRSREEHPVDGNISETIQEYKDDLLVRQKEYFNDELTLEMVYTYDDDRRLILNEVFNNDGSINSRYTYEYDGDTTIERYFDEELRPVRIIETTDNADGQPVEKKATEIYDDREVVHIQKVEYEVEDNEYIKTYFNDGAEVFQMIEEKDDAGRVVSTVRFDIAGDVETVVDVVLDEDGRITREVVTENEVVIRTTDLVLDDFGNRVEVVEESLVGDDHMNRAVYKFVNEYTPA